MPLWNSVIDSVEKIVKENTLLQRENAALRAKAVGAANKIEVFYSSHGKLSREDIHFLEAVHRQLRN